MPGVKSGYGFRRSSRWLELRACSFSGMTLAEVMIATAIFGLVFGSVLAGLSRATYRANWAACSMEATKLAQQRLEQVYSGQWDRTVTPVIDELVASNFPLTAVALFTYPTGGSLIATSSVSFTTLPSTNNPSYKVVSSMVTWSYRGRGPFTNNLTTIRTLSY
jgi:prepilin-type N-terminal cleavage/methylation domain-containing protein